MMKKTLFISASLAAVLFACKKQSTTSTATPTNDTKDQTPPVITLKGKANDTISLGSTYNDPGATAADDVDGDLSAFVIASGVVTTTVTGNYTREYNLRDAAGNIAVKKTRNVRVQNDIGYLDGNYNAVCNYTVTLSGGSPTVSSNSYPLSVSSSSVTNKSFSISKFPVAGNTVTYNSLFLTSDGTSLNPFVYGSGTGTVSASKNSFTIDATLNDINYPSRVTTCKVVHTRN